MEPLVYMILLANVTVLNRTDFVEEKYDMYCNRTSSLSEKSWTVIMTNKVQRE